MICFGNVFDAHAHVGVPDDNALVCTSSPEEALEAKGFRFLAAGLLPESGARNLDLLEKLAAQGHPIGEVGLDRRFPDTILQERLFKDTIHIANAYGALLVIHSVRTTDKVLQILKSEAQVPFLVHGFTGSVETAREILSLGGNISLGPRALYTRHFGKLLSSGIPFLTETDMKTGPEQRKALQGWNTCLSEKTGIDVEKRTRDLALGLLGVSF